MTATGPAPPAPTWLAAGICGAYLVLAVLFGGRVPFLERRMFEFAALEPPVAAPLFRVDGVWSDVHDYRDFQGFDVDALLVAPEDLVTTVAHHFHDQHAWIARHPLPPNTESGPHGVEVGVLILDRAPDGTVTATERVDATGTARRR